MAHVGKDWKLWFRRDVSIRVDNYRFAFPEAYKVVVLGPQSSARYAISLLPTVQAINLHKDFELTWRSETVGGFFDNAYWQVTLPLNNQLNVDTMRVQYWHDAIIPTPLFDAIYYVGFPFNSYPAWRNGPLKELLWLSPDITLNPDDYHCHIEAARWDDYNP